MRKFELSGALRDFHGPRGVILSYNLYCHVIMRILSNVGGLEAINSEWQIRTHQRFIGIESGLSLRQIAERTGRSKTKIREDLLASGVAIREYSRDQRKKLDLTQVARSGNPPFGVADLEGKLVVDPHEYKVLLEIHRRWRSGESLGDVFEDIDRTVDTFLHPTYASTVNFQPSCDVNETKDHYLASFDMPSVKKEDIKIEVQGNELVISGEP